MSHRRRPRHRFDCHHNRSIQQGYLCRHIRRIHQSPGTLRWLGNRNCRPSCRCSYPRHRRCRPHRHLPHKSHCIHSARHRNPRSRQHHRKCRHHLHPRGMSHRRRPRHRFDCHHNRSIQQGYLCRHIRRIHQSPGTLRWLGNRNCRPSCRCSYPRHRRCRPHPHQPSKRHHRHPKHRSDCHHNRSIQQGYLCRHIRRIHH